MNNVKIRSVVAALTTGDVEAIGECLEKLPEEVSVKIKRLLFEASDVGRLDLGRDKTTGQVGVFQSHFEKPLPFDHAALILLNYLVIPSKGEKSPFRTMGKRYVEAFGQTNLCPKMCPLFADIWFTGDLQLVYRQNENGFRAQKKVFFAGQLVVKKAAGRLHKPKVVSSILTAAIILTLELGGIYKIRAFEDFHVFCSFFKMGTKMGTTCAIRPTWSDGNWISVNRLHTSDLPLWPR